MSEKEKTTGEALYTMLLRLPEAKRNRALGVVEGMALMAEPYSAGDGQPQAARAEREKGA